MKHPREDRLWDLARHGTDSKEQFLIRRHMMDCDRCASSYAELKPLVETVDAYGKAVAKAATLSDEHHEALWLMLEDKLDEADFHREEPSMLARLFRPALAFSGWLLPGLALAAVMTVAATQIEWQSDQAVEPKMPALVPLDGGNHTLAGIDNATQNDTNSGNWIMEPGLAFWPVMPSDSSRPSENLTPPEGTTPSLPPQTTQPAAPPRPALAPQAPPTAATNPTQSDEETETVEEHPEDVLAATLERLYREGDYQGLIHQAQLAHQGENLSWTPRARYLYALSLRATGKQNQALDTLEQLAAGKDSLLADRARYEKAVLLCEIPGRDQDAKAALTAYLAAPGAKPFAEEMRYRLCLGASASQSDWTQSLSPCMDYLAHHATGYRATPVAERVAKVLSKHRRSCSEVLPLAERLPYGTLRQGMQEEMDYLCLRCYIHLEKGDMARQAAERYLRRHPTGNHRPVAQDWLSNVSDTPELP